MGRSASFIIFPYINVYLSTSFITHEISISRLLPFFCRVGQKMVWESNVRTKCLQTFLQFLEFREHQQKRNDAYLRYNGAKWSNILAESWRQ